SFSRTMGRLQHRAGVGLDHGHRLGGGCASWYARCGDKSYGTASFADAKAAARAFVTGAALEKDELAFAGAVDLNAAAVKALESQAPQTMKAGSTGREKVVVSNNVKTTE